MFGLIPPRLLQSHCHLLAEKISCDDVVRWDLFQRFDDELPDRTRDVKRIVIKSSFEDVNQGAKSVSQVDFDLLEDWRVP